MLRNFSKRSLLSGFVGTLQRLLIASLLFSLPLHATVIMRLGFEELVAQSSLIFHGEVIDSVVTRQGDLVYTTVTFAPLEPLKGELPDDQVSLRFLGGTVDDMAVTVEGQFIPAVGDRGVYFVATTQEEQVNPLTGWHQGFFPLLTSSAGEDFIDMRQRPDFVVPGLEDDPLVNKMQQLGFSAEEIQAKLPQAMQFSWPDFRDAILAEVVVQGGDGR